MWNGLWKLTVMVGVVGVGLFAAWQAQKGMNLTGFQRAAGPGNEKAESTAASPEKESALEPASQQQEPLFLSDSGRESTTKAGSRSKKKPKQDFDFFDDTEEEQPTAQKSSVSTKAAESTESAKRNPKRLGVNFREQPESTDESIAEQTAEPERLPEDETIAASSVKKARQPIRQVKAESAEKEADPAKSDGDLDPFADDIAEVTGNQSSKDVKATKSSKDGQASGPAGGQSSSKETDETPEEPAQSKEPEKYENPFGDEQPAKEQQSAEIESAPKTEEIPKSREPSDVAGKAKVYSDSSANNAPPRSKRAQLNSNKKAEPALPLNLDVDPIASSPSVIDATPATPANLEADPQTSARTKKSGTTETPLKKVPANETSAPTEKRVRNELISVPDSEPISTPSNPPETSSFGLENTPPTNRPAPNRNRPAPPAQLSEEPNAGFLTETLPNQRAQQKRNDADKASVTEMLGDGIAGDASQRGVQQPRISIEKVAQQQAVLDQPFVYSIIIRNTGSVDAHNLVIEDRIPKGTELVGTAPQAELAGKRLIWNHQVLKPNEEKKISIKVIPKQEGPVGSVARVYFATEVSAEIVVAAPQLEFTVKAPSEVRIGQHFDLVFSLKNVGTVDANNIIVRDLVPEELKHEAGLDIECPIGKMAPQESREIVLPVTAMKTGTIVNKAMLTADSGVKKNLDSSINIIGEVLVLTRAGHNRLYVERTAAFTNTVRNDGNRRAEKVRISEVVPAGMQFETASDGGKYDANSNAVVWTVGPLAPGADKVLTVNYVPKETGTHSTKITATGNAGSTASIQSTVDVYGKPELQMETLSATGAVTIGDRITSKFQLNNTGTAAASNVQLRIKLPRELKLVSINGARYQQKDNVILFESITELPPRSKASYELVLEPIAEADAQIGLEISADHLTKPGRRVETIQIARDALK